MTPREDGRLYIRQGEQVEKFEEEFSVLVGAKQRTVAVNNCTSAITLALWLCGVRAGDWVIATPMTCSATVTPILNLQAKVLWADVDPLTGLIDPKSVEECIKSIWPRPSSYNANALSGEYWKPKSIIAVDWAGASCDYKSLKQFGIPVIQDAAHRVFALNGENGDYVCWSHGEIKHLSCINGGSLLVPPEQYQCAKLLRWYGLDRESKADFRCSQSINEAGFKFSMNDVFASVGRANIKHARSIVERHRANAKALGATDNHSDYWFYPTHVEDKEKFKAFMHDKGIMVSPVHRRNDEHACFAQYKRYLPGLDAFSRTNIGIPAGWWLTMNDIDQIREAMKEWNQN